MMVLLMQGRGSDYLNLKVIGITIIAIIICCIDFPSIFRNKDWRGLFVYIGFLVSGVAIITMQLYLNYDVSKITSWLIEVYS